MTTTSEPLRILLRDRNEGLAVAWREHFRGIDAVEASTGDIFGVQADAIVSPANSFGFMDGGIDFAYSEYFGWDLGERLQALLRAEYDGELPVGQAVIVPTNHATIRYLVSAPTMRIPMPVADTLNAYLAFRAALGAVRDFNAANAGAIRSLMCPGLATAIGRMPYDRCARQMRVAYDNIELRQVWAAGVVGKRLQQHQDMLR
jgi:O-acetyl-ADP-ribose deacetylase (regulator of RNase III)